MDYRSGLKRPNAFTLIELVVTIAVMAVIMAVTGVAVRQLNSEPTPLSCVEELEKYFMRLRHQACALKQKQQLVFNVENRTFSLKTKVLTIPDHFQINLNAELPPPGDYLIQFYPDGKSSLSSLRISDGESNAELIISPLCGVMKIEEK
ncbi:MAG: type II secretion system protein [Victivallaceae bacterium]